MKNKNRKIGLFIVLLCVNILIFVLWLQQLLMHGYYFWLNLPMMLIVQFILAILSVGIYYFIDLVEATKKIAHQKETNNTTLPEEKKEENE